MDIVKIIEAIPQILQFFLPGYVAVVIFTTIAVKKMESSEKVIISCLISFLLVSAIKIIFPNMLIWATILVTYTSSIVLSLVFTMLFLCDWVNRAIISLFSQSPLNSIWEKEIDFEHGTNLKIFLKNKDYYFIGHYKSHENREGDIWFTIYGYMKFDSKTNGKLADFSNFENIKLLFNLRDIEVMELAVSVDEENSNTKKKKKLVA